MSVMYIRNEQTGEFEPVPSLVGPQGPPGANGGGAGTVTSVNKVAPDANGNVTLTAADVGALGKNETAANANQLNGKSADQYALKTDLPKAGDWDGNTVPKDIPDGISYVEAGVLTNGHGFPVGYCTVLSVKDNVTRLFQILVEKENGRMQIRSAKDGTTWGEWQSYLRNTDTAADSLKLDGKDSVYYHKKLSHPRNLLDNSDFRNPVNQRGRTGYVRNGYTIDRWVLWGDLNTESLAIENGYIALNPETGSIVTLAQRFAKGYLDENKTYTLAYADTRGNIHTINNPVRHSDEIDYVEIVAKEWIGVLWAALYEGSYTADNLPPYVPKGYAAELAECMRYAVDVENAVLSGVVKENGVCEAFLPLNVSMRKDANPTVTIKNALVAYTADGNNHALTFTQALVRNTGLLLTFSCGSTINAAVNIPTFNAFISVDL